MESTDLAAATAAGARIVRAVRAVRTDDGQPVSVSVGTPAALGGDVDALVHRADDALYSAKRAGRNRVVASGPAVVVALSQPSADEGRGPQRPLPVPRGAGRG